MVGLGTQDDLSEAEEFVADTGVKHQMVWDASGESWRYFELPTQPSSVLVGPDGTTIATFKGSLRLDDALEAARR